VTVSRRLSYAIVISIIGLTLTCGDTGVSPREEPTDQDAIYNIIRYDRPSEFNLDLFNLSVPDTLLMLAGPVVPGNYWYSVEKESLFIAIDIRYVQPGDPPGTIPLASVTETKHFWGTFELIGVDTTGGQHVPVRLSKDFLIVGTLEATFEKYGFDYNFRRGWILTRVSDAVYGGGYVNGIDQVRVRSESGRDFTVNTQKKAMADIVRFVPGDSLTITVTTLSSDDYLEINYLSPAGFTSIKLEPDGSGIVEGGLRLTNNPGYDHLFINVLSNSTLTGLLEFRTTGVGLIYKVE